MYVESEGENKWSEGAFLYLFDSPLIGVFFLFLIIFLLSLCALESFARSEWVKNANIAKHSLQRTPETQGCDVHSGAFCGVGGAGCSSLLVILKWGEMFLNLDIITVFCCLKEVGYCVSDRVMSKSKKASKIQFCAWMTELGAPHAEVEG